ncbi:MAG: CRTAC1 family protein [Planctomycetes bacterium]|nr:CRTAC1 family protein [Planctomycetota bacterium]
MSTFSRVAAWSLSMVAVAQNPAPDRWQQSHDRMLRELRGIADRVDQDNWFFGTFRVRDLRAQMEREGARAPWKLRMDTGIAELQAGNERAGIDVLAATVRDLRAGSIPGGRAALNAVVFHLGVGWLRLAETENCCARPSLDSCILPIQGAGVHERREGSTAAIPCFLDLVENTRPDDYWHHAGRWLLNLAHMTLGSWPDGVPEAHRLPASAFAPEREFPRFRNIAPTLKLDRFGLSGGLIVDDFDGDEHLDVLVSDWNPRAQLRLYRNARDGSFEEVTERAGLTGLFGGLNLVHADYDNDGDLDFLVLRGAWWFERGQHPNSLVRNNGDGTFTDVTFAAGLGERHYPTQTAAFADIDLDGDLDLYIGNEGSQQFRCPCQLFVNQGDGTFVEQAGLAGVENFRFAKGVAFGDYDGDRWPDLYVSNIGGPNRLYRNRGDSTFTDVAETVRVTGPEQSFPTWFWDYDNDGAQDLFVACYGTGIGHVGAWYAGATLPRETPRLYRNDGRGGFADVAKAAAFDYPSLPMGSAFGDLDNDGWLDCYLGTGDPQYYSLMPNVMFRSRGDGTFEQVTMAGGFGHLQKGHAVAFADWDHDGDQDVFEKMGGAYPGDGAYDLVFDNPGFGNHWLTVRLRGTTSNRCALGARVRVDIVEGGKTRSIYRHVGPAGSFGGNPLRLTFGLGKAESIARCEVFWPMTGKTQVVADVAMDSAIIIAEGQDAFVTLDLPKLTAKPPGDQR